MGLVLNAAVAVDLAILTVRDAQLQILLVRRGTEPFLGSPALPGGFVEVDEDLDEAAARELAEETGLYAGRLHLEQLASYGRPDRDPRGRIVSVCYLAIMPDLPVPAAGGDAAEALWHPASEILDGTVPLAFDHNQIASDAVERARSRLEYTTLAAAFCPDEFTVGELRRIYEIVWGHRLDPRNFHRKISGVPDFLMPTGRRTTRDGGRPAALYRRGSAALMHPPLTRPSTIMQSATNAS